MKNIKLYTTTAIIAFMTLTGPAFAHDGDMTDANHHHMHKHGEFKHDKAAFEKMHALHKKLHDVIVADKFDRKAFLDLSAQIEQLRGQIERRHTEAFANKLAQMSPADRAHLAEKFHEHMMMHHDGKGWDHKGWGDHDDHVNWSHDDSQSSNNYGREAPNH